MPAGAAQLHAELVQAQAVIAGLERFVYICSHDLREPLRMITGFLGLLQRRSQGMSAAQLEYLGLSLDGAMRLDAMLEALLRHSRLGRTRSVGAVALGPLAREVQERLGAAHGLPASIWTTGELPEVWADRQQLETMLSELFANALRFIAPGTTPSVAFSALPAAAGGWRLRVADRGLGIPSGERERAFEVFSRLHTVPGEQGVGIGLSLCAKIVEQHRGRIWIEDNPPDHGHPAGGGTVVLIELPGRPPR